MLEIVQKADAQARKRFTYKSDKPGEDQWRSSANLALQDKPWSGDCDDLASTACDIATRRGVPLKHLWFACVSSQNNKKIDHMIAFYNHNGKLYVIGDTFGPCYPIAGMSHGPVKDGARFYVANLANVMKWNYLTLDEISKLK